MPRPTVTRAEIADEMLRGCPEEARADHIVLSDMVRDGVAVETILGTAEAERWPCTYVWLRTALDGVQ